MKTKKAGIFTTDGTDNTDLQQEKTEITAKLNPNPSVSSVASCSKSSLSENSGNSVVQFLCVRLAALLACVLLLPSAFCLRASGQNYTISWYKIAGGGGTSSGGSYSVSGTIGQPEAGGAMSGGNYSVTGGFWSLISVVQTPGSHLTITHAGNSVIVSWPNMASYTLQQNNNLAVSAGWAASAYAITTNANGTNSITITPPAGNLFFRLNNP